jgi:Flp pilus assembly protein TadD
MGVDGLQAFRRGNYAGAREAYRRVLKVDPDNLPALVNLGVTEYRLGQYDEAERLLQSSLRLKPDHATAWLNLGILYLDRDQTMPALAALAQAVVHAPSDPVARNYLGVAAGRNGWFDAAESELRRAVELRPEYADAHFNLAVFCLERNPPAVELARRHYRRARDLGAAPDALIEQAVK